MNAHIYIIHSDALNKRWVVIADSVEDATNKVVASCRELFVEMEADNPNENIAIDLSVQGIEKDVTEL